MKKYALLIQYDGKRFFGFQVQDNHTTVQGFLEKTIAIFTRHPVRIYGAGRTDTGVHAIGQVVHFETPLTLDTYALLSCLNSYGRVIGVSAIEAREVDPDFHARFSAKAREYIYVIRNHPHPAIHMQDRCYHVTQKLDLANMLTASTKLLGTHDFESFRSSKCQAPHAIRCLDTLEIKQEGDSITLHLRARSFLHNQVRIMVGTLVMIGKGDHPATWIDDLFEVKDRKASGLTAPAHGLYFKHVDYGEELFQTHPSLTLLG